MTIAEAEAKRKEAREKYEAAKLEVIEADALLYAAQEEAFGIRTGDLVQQGDEVYKIAQVKFMRDGEPYGFEAFRQLKNGSFGVQRRFIASRQGYKIISPDGVTR